MVTRFLRHVGLPIVVWGLGLPLAVWAQDLRPADDLGNEQDTARYRDLTYRDDAWYGSTYWAGPGWTRVGKDWHHPHTDTAAVRRFVVPSDGRVTVTGRVYKLDTNNGGGDGVRLMIRHGRRTVWQAEIDGNDTKGVQPELAIDVRAGDAIRFIVHKRGHIFHDTTHWDPVVSCADGRRFRASEAFAARKQGHGGWFYEMEVDPQIEPGLPRVHGFGPEMDLGAMVQDAWSREDKLDDRPEFYAAATARHIEKARRLLEDLRNGQPGSLLAAEREQLERLAAVKADSLPDHKRLYRQVRQLKRRIVLANPLLTFDRLLFTKRVPTSYSHLVMQYFGWRARPGGGIFLLDRPGHSLKCHDILGGKLQKGNVLEPRLSCDARRIVFSFVKCPEQRYDPAQLNHDADEGFYHVYEVKVDGTGLRQLTSGPYDDVMPTYLPDGGIAFCSTRRRGYARCFGGQFSRRWHVYTLHRIDADGTNLRTLSFHDTNEWFPAVSNTGHVLYARWDYIDRDAVTHQNLWATRPDGTNPAAVWGNATSSPHCSFQIQPIPGGGKIVFTASAHHSIAGGSIAVVDPTVAVDGHAAITRITPEVPFPEAESRDIREYYAAPWPLSEKYFLVAYSPTPLVWEPGANRADALGIYVLDVFGNRELIYRDPAIGSTNPCPLVPRPTPLVLADVRTVASVPTGEMAVANVYEGLGRVPRGTIKQLRLIQILPKTTNLADNPPVGLAREENARAVLGTVPVEPDGSAYFVVPAGRPILFQALDEEGMAYQTMRSVTYVQPGERVTCIGCHENRMTAPTNRPPAALRRPPSQIAPGQFGGRPFSFVRVVQPVLQKHCIGCHGNKKREGGVDLTATPERGFTKSYWALCGDRNFWGAGTNAKNAAEALVPRFGGRNQVQITPPGGMYGARGSRLLKLLRAGHEGAKLSAEEFRRLALWIDCNAVFYGVYDPADQARQLRGELVSMPEIQ